MNPSPTIDQDDVLRARTKLLAATGPTRREEVEAYRVLAQVNPATHLPRLVDALLSLSYDHGLRDSHPLRLALCEEAVAAARAIDPGTPDREKLLFRAFLLCHRELYALGRRAEGLAMLAEMVAMERSWGELSKVPAVSALHLWATALAEEGRRAEAADALAEWVAAIRPLRPDFDTLARPLAEWAATLADAGRIDEALAAFEVLVGLDAGEDADDRGPLACHFYALVRYAELLDGCGHAERAAAARQSALAALTELATTGERKVRSGDQAPFWATLLSWSAADGERLASDGPCPPSGAGPRQWSAGVRQRYFDRLVTLREQVNALAEDPDRHLPELLRLHRVLTVRSAVQCEHRTYAFAAQLPELQPLFDEGVELARRLDAHDPAAGGRTLAEVLIDRSTFRTAACRFDAALGDFREALGLRGEDH
ncbi:hypothetical protein ACI1MP_05985 [Kitasatospora griseola]|uniref:hypothetical protein n=1 Tax=Kitasatospora griseola TaxID=2064 RepID=UPI0038558C76